MKTCIRCKKEKEESEFGRQISRYKDKVYFGLKGNCSECLNEIAKDNYRKVKDDQEFKKKNRARIKAYRHKIGNKDKAKQKKRRQSEKYKATRKRYIEAHKEKIFQQESIVKDRFFKKHRDNISDSYVINLLMKQGHGTHAEVQDNKELIEIKRTQILLFRLKRKIKAKNKK